MKFYQIVITIFCAIILNAQNKYELDQITVTSEKMPISINNDNRDVIILDELQLKKFSNVSLDYILKELAGIDIRQRGTDGVQADVSIRGGTFEQTLIMLDGMKINDTQTGHHNLNIPVTANDIQRIEIIKGQASKAFGPNAFNGVVNIITKKFSNDKIDVGMSGGTYNSYRTELSFSKRIDNIYNRISISKSKSDGYKRNTEYENKSFYYSTNYAVNNFQSFLSFGYLDKDYGANSFYSSKYPDQAERTITKFASLQNIFVLSGIDFATKVYWRRNDDNFVLNKFNPSFYKNLHQTNTYGSSLQVNYKYNFTNFTIGSEIIHNDINSTNLGVHKRLDYGFFIEALNQFDIFSFGIGGFAYSINKKKLEFWPGVDFKYRLNEIIELTASVGKAFRAPTFTELYYHDPITQSNPKLKREESINSEIGISITEKWLKSKSNLFLNKEKNLIDWVRNSIDEKWLAKNISKVDIAGIETELTVYPEFFNQNLFIKNLTLRYTYLSVEKKFGYNFSKYALENLKHKFFAEIENQLFLDVKMQTQFFYEARENYSAQHWVDFTFTKEFDDLFFLFNIKNAFNNKILDFLNIKLPGRTFSFGVKYGINF